MSSQHHPIYQTEDSSALFLKKLSGFLLSVYACSCATPIIIFVFFVVSPAGFQRSQLWRYDVSILCVKTLESFMRDTDQRNNTSLRHFFFTKCCEYFHLMQTIWDSFGCPVIIQNANKLHYYFQWHKNTNVHLTAY